MLKPPGAKVRNPRPRTPCIPIQRTSSAPTGVAHPGMGAEFRGHNALDEYSASLTLAFCGATVLLASLLWPGDFDKSARSVQARRALFQTKDAGKQPQPERRSLQTLDSLDF